MICFGTFIVVNFTIRSSLALIYNWLIVFIIIVLNHDIDACLAALRIQLWFLNNSNSTDCITLFLLIMLIILWIILNYVFSESNLKALVLTTVSCQIILRPIYTNLRILWFRTNPLFTFDFPLSNLFKIKPCPRINLPNMPSLRVSNSTSITTSLCYSSWCYVNNLTLSRLPPRLSLPLSPLSVPRFQDR